MADQRIGPGCNDGLLCFHGDRRGREGVGSKHEKDQHESAAEQQIPDQHDGDGDVGPAEAVVQPRDHIQGSIQEQQEGDDDFLTGLVFGSRSKADPSLEEGGMFQKVEEHGQDTRNADESEDPCLPVRSRPRRYIQQDAHHDGQADKFDHCDPMFCLRMDLHRRVLSCRARSRSRGEPHLHLRVQFSGVDALSPSSDDRFPRASPHCLTVSILLYAIYSI